MPFFDNLAVMTKALTDAEDERKAIAEGIMEALPDAIFVVNESGAVVMANQSALNLSGYKNNELLGMNIEMLVPPERRARHREERSEYSSNPINRPMNEGRELLLLRKDSTQVYVLIALNPVRTRTGNCTIAVVRINEPNGS